MISLIAKFLQKQKQKRKEKKKIEVNDECTNNYMFYFQNLKTIYRSFSLGQNGKYWSVASDASINADSGEPQPFYFELCGQSRFYIRAPNGSYIKGEQNGIFSATADLSKATKWEY